MKCNKRNYGDVKNIIDLVPDSKPVFDISDEPEEINYETQGTKILINTLLIMQYYKMWKKLKMDCYFSGFIKKNCLLVWYI